MRTDIKPSSKSQPVGSVTIAPDELDGALDVVREGQDKWSVLISPHREHPQRRRLVYQGRAALEETRVAFHVTKLSPLGTSVLTEMAQPLLKVLSPDRILPALAVLESQIRCLTVTPSVVNMNEPKVPLWLHARSWIPGGTYVAERGQKARPFSRKKPEKALQHFVPAAEGFIAVVAESDAVKARGDRLSTALETLLEHLDPKDVVRRPNLDPKWWGSPRAAQIVLAPTNLATAARLAAETDPVVDDIPARTLSRPQILSTAAGGSLENNGAQEDEAR